MDDLTPIDAAHAAMTTAPEDETARLRFYDRLANAELFVLLQVEPEGDEITPEVFDLSDNSFVLAFDREMRLTAFTNRPSPYAALSGRAICRMLAQAGLGLGLNLDVAPSAYLVPPEAVAWLAETLDIAPDELQGKVENIFPPKGLPEELLPALDAKLASATGLASSAYLVGVRYDSGVQGHLLGLVDAAPGAEPALARAVSEALTFSGLAAASLDVAFFRSSDPMAAHLARHGLRFDLPLRETGKAPGPAAPGMDPDKPPILK